MAYTTTDDILNYFNGLEYTDSEDNDNNISETKVSQFITEQTVIIDLIIGKKYELPVTDTSDLTYLKLVNDKLVVCQIDKILRTWASDDESDKLRRRNYCKEAKEMLKDIIKGEIELNTDQKSFIGVKYNKTTVYDDDCECRIEEVDCDDDDD